MVDTEFLAHFNIPSCGEQQPCYGNGWHYLSLKGVHTYLIVRLLVKATDGRLWRITARSEQNRIGAWTKPTEMVLVPSANGAEILTGLPPLTYGFSYCLFSTCRECILALCCFLYYYYENTALMPHCM